MKWQSEKVMIKPFSVMAYNQNTTVSRLFCPFILSSLIQATIAGIMKQNHD